VSRGQHPGEGAGVHRALTVMGNEPGILECDTQSSPAAVKGTRSSSSAHVSWALLHLAPITHLLDTPTGPADFLDQSVRYL
jgi:hypothetical protein